MKQENSTGEEPRAFLHQLVGECAFIYETRCPIQFDFERRRQKQIGVRQGSLNSVHFAHQAS